jgi:hypothetical protein
MLTGDKIVEVDPVHRVLRRVVVSALLLWLEKLEPQKPADERIRIKNGQLQLPGQGI